MSETTQTERTTKPPKLLPGPSGGTGILSAMHDLVVALPAIAKNRENTEQGFKFRGYDDVLNALNPLLGEHGVFYTVNVLERLTERRTTRNGGTMYEVNLHNEYTWWCVEDGSCLVTDGWGEGTDSGDKATPKAMTGALKYVLFQVLAISTQEAAETDADRGHPEETTEDYANCGTCQAKLMGGRSDVEVVRTHMVERHGYTRLDDGRVAKPAEPEPVTPPPDRSEQDKAPDAPPPTTEPEPAAKPDNEPQAPESEPPAEEDSAAWVWELKGDALKDQAKVWGVPRKNADEMRQDIYNAVKAAETAEAEQQDEDGFGSAEDGVDTDASTEPETEFVELDPETLRGKVTDEGLETIAAADGEFSPEGYVCEECPPDSPTTPSVRHFYAHWYLEHDPDRPQPEPEPAPKPGPPKPAAGKQEAAAPSAADPDDLPALIARCKARMSKVNTAQAKAYSAWRKDNGLDRVKPDDMTLEQAQLLDAFFTEQGVPEPE